MTGHFTSYETRTDQELATVRRNPLDKRAIVAIIVHLK
jgi:hypothetical protein